MSAWPITDHHFRHIDCHYSRKWESRAVTGLSRPLRNRLASDDSLDLTPERRGRVPFRPYRYMGPDTYKPCYLQGLFRASKEFLCVSITERFGLESITESNRADLLNFAHFFYMKKNRTAPVGAGVVRDLSSSQNPI